MNFCTPCSCNWLCAYFEKDEMRLQKKKKKKKKHGWNAGVHLEKRYDITSIPEVR